MNCLSKDLIVKLGHELFEYDDTLSTIFEVSGINTDKYYGVIVTGYIYIEDDEECYFKVNLYNYNNDIVGEITDIIVENVEGFTRGLYYYLHQTGEFMNEPDYINYLSKFNTEE